METLLQRVFDHLIRRIPEDNETALQFLPADNSEEELEWAIGSLLDHYDNCPYSY